MKTFNVSKADKIIIYGAAYIGKDILHRVRNLGYNVECFLDKRADKLISVDNVNVFCPDKYETDKENAVVIIATGNPNSVANYLVELGYRKIVYDAYATNLDNGAVVYMAKVYDGIMGGNDFLKDIPYYYRDVMDNRFHDNGYITEENGKVVAYISADLFFVKEGKKDSHFYCKYANLISYIKAYDGNAINIAETISSLSKKICVEKLSGSDFGEMEEDRRLYTQTQLNKLNLKLNYGMEWFISNAIDIKAEGTKFIVDEKDVFRVAFFLAKGLQRVPARMTKSDYEHLKNLSVLNETIEYAKTHDLLTSYTLLEHPNFYSFPAARDIGAHSRMINICKYIADNGICISDKKVIDVGSYFGYLSRFFYRMGAKVTSVEYNEEGCNFGKKLNALLYCEGIETVCGGAQELNRKNEFDIAVMLTVLYWHLDSPLGIELIHAVDEMTKSMMIWESGDEPEREKEFIINNSAFKKYVRIAETVGTGKVREMGIWYK